MIEGHPLQMPDAVTVLVSTELLAQLEADWSAPMQIHIDRTPGIGSGYEMICRQVDGKTSDGYHTFDELYRFRLLYNAALFNEWARTTSIETVRSWHHFEGDLCFGGGWFVVMANLPTGQISNHYPAEAWDLFHHVDAQERAWEWDGHTAADVADRLELWLRADQ